MFIFYFGVNVYMSVCLYVYACVCICMWSCVHVYVCGEGGTGKGHKRVLEPVLQAVVGQEIWMLGTPVLLKG